MSHHQDMSMSEQLSSPHHHAGEMSFLAHRDHNPLASSSNVADRILITLTIDSAEDVEILSHGIGSLRRNKILRLTCEARGQGGLLTQEDLARLTCASRSTIKRDIAHLRAHGFDVPTRGKVKNLERTFNYQTLIVGDWLKGHDFDEIGRRRDLPPCTIRSCCLEFLQIIHLLLTDIDKDTIHRELNLHPQLVVEHIDLYRSINPDDKRLRSLLDEYSVKSTTP
jgi:biotin operon repressor